MKESVKSILKLIWQYIKKGLIWIFSNLERAIIIALCLVILVLSVRYCSTQNELAKTKAELIETVDTVAAYKNKVGELYAQKEAYMIDAKTLKHLNDSLYKEYKNLKDHPTVIVKTETVFQVDSIYVKGDEVVKDTINNIYSANFKRNEKWYSISGQTIFDLNANEFLTIFDSIKIPGTFTTDLVERDNNLYFVTKCNNPYIQINNIEGVVLTQEFSKLLDNRYKKPWSLVIGVGPSVTYFDNKFRVYPSINLTFGYKIIDFKI
jgi:cell division protein FtsL